MEGSSRNTARRNRRDFVDFKERERVQRVSQVLRFSAGWSLSLLTELWNIGECTVLCNELHTSESSIFNMLFLRYLGQIQAEILVGRYKSVVSNKVVSIKMSVEFKW